MIIYPHNLSRRIPSYHLPWRLDTAILDVIHSYPPFGSPHFLSVGLTKLVLWVSSCLLFSYFVDTHILIVSQGPYGLSICLDDYKLDSHYRGAYGITVCLNSVVLNCYHLDLKPVLWVPSCLLCCYLVKTHILIITQMQVVLPTVLMIILASSGCIQYYRLPRRLYILIICQGAYCLTVCLDD